MNKYEVLGVVGEGAYGVVLKCLNKETKEIMAIKKFKESEEDENIRKNAHREVKVLKQLKHRNIVDLREAFRRKGKLYLVFEYVEKCLLEVIEENKTGADPDLIRSIIYQLLLALDFLHKNNVLHRDIKPENLLLSKDGILKLCDFGFARAIPEGKDELTDYVATRWYRPPELLLNSKNYDRSVDLWATACIMGELIDSKPLFPGEDDLDQLYLIQRTLGPLTGAQLGLLLMNQKFKGKLVTTNIEETLHDRYRGKMSQSGLDFMCSLLKIDPKHRLTTEQALSHPYFEGMRTTSSLKDLNLAPSKLLTSSLSTNITKGDGAALQGESLTRNDSKNDELAYKKGGQSVESQASTQPYHGGSGPIGGMVPSHHGGDQNQPIQHGDGEVASPVKSKNNTKFKVSMPSKQGQGQFGPMAVSQGHLQLGAPTMYVNPAIQSQHIQFGSQQRDNAHQKGEYGVYGKGKAGLEITNGMNYHQPMMTFDGAPKKKHGESFQHLNSKRNANVKSLKTFYNPATMGTSVNPSSTMISVPRNASIITGTQIPSLQASNSNSKVVKQKLYPFADHHLAPKNMTIQNFREGDQQLDGGQPMTMKRGGGGAHEGNNSLLPAIHIKNLNNNSTSSQFMKQVPLSTIANTYNIPFPKMKHDQGAGGQVTGHNGGSVNGQQTGGNGGGGGAGMTNPRNVYNSNLYNYTITNGVSGSHTNGRVAAKVMN